MGVPRPGYGMTNLKSTLNHCHLTYKLLSMKIKSIFLLFGLYFIQYACAQKSKSFDVQSPDGNIQLHVDATNKIMWSAKNNNEQVIEPSIISLQLQNETLGNNTVITSSKTEKVNTVINAINYIKATIPDKYITSLPLFVKAILV